MHGCITAINALLPPEYQVIISTAEYEELARAEINYTCNNCEEQIEKKDVLVFGLIPNSMQLLLHGSEAQKVWNCPKCKETNMLESTKISKTTLQDPTFLGVVPASPRRTNGLMDRMKFNIEIERWGWLILGELEFKMGKFRDDNWKRGDNDDISTQLDFSLDDKAGAKSDT